VSWLRVGRKSNRLAISSAPSPTQPGGMRKQTKVNSPRPSGCSKSSAQKGLPLNSSPVELADTSALHGASDRYWPTVVFRGWGSALRWDTTQSGGLLIHPAHPYSVQVLLTQPTTRGASPGAVATQKQFNSPTNQDIGAPRPLWSKSSPDNLEAKNRQRIRAMDCSRRRYGRRGELGRTSSPTATHRSLLSLVESSASPDGVCGLLAIG
jgi:hypothetical protein